QHPPDADGVEPPVVDQAPNRLRMNAELVGDIANADQAFGLMLRRRHAARNLPQVTPDCGLELTYRHRARELRLDPPVRADEERPRLRGQMPFLVPAVEALPRIVAGVDLDVDEANSGPREATPCRIDDVDDWAARPARAPTRRRERQDEGHMRCQRILHRV